MLIVILPIIVAHGINDVLNHTIPMSPQLEGSSFRMCICVPASLHISGHLDQKRNQCSYSAKRNAMQLHRITSLNNWWGFHTEPQNLSIQ
eukprot:1513820-Ditylum_brightwellii.AAC.1